ncbi:putative vanillyl-alcohol oxidase [Rosellinia necatrix]|uniref:Putative vanillyl-alcohol oxidase n=1 Tax=Rosellinia necatrix TaxID=77044 RepID=A0A1S8A8D4_ROSNE|nr:putative vanillyl-alcohol oxidase [Rosellinia necatrix]
MADSANDTIHVPLLSEKHSGIPERLLEKAQHAKAHALSVVTKVQGARHRALAYPPGVEERVFADAVKELRTKLGEDYVVHNDQPLEDGWYMERELTICDINSSVYG